MDSRLAVIFLTTVTVLSSSLVSAASTATPTSPTTTLDSCTHLTGHDTNLLEQLNSSFWQNYLLVRTDVSAVNTVLPGHKLPVAVVDNCPFPMQSTKNAAIIKPYAEGPCAWEYTCNYNLDRYPSQLQMVRCKRDKYTNSQTQEPFYVDKVCADSYQSPNGGIAMGDCKELFMDIPMLFRAKCSDDVSKDAWVWENQEVAIGCYCNPNYYYAPDQSISNGGSK